LTEAFRSALRELMQNRSFIDAIDNPAHDLFTLRRLIARAVVAWCLTIQSSGPWTDVEPAERNDLVDQLTMALGTELGLFDALSRTSLRMSGSAAQAMWRRQRGAYGDKASPFASDVLRFLAHGDNPRQFIADQIRDAEAPVVLLGHSLGGIMCVDLLCRDTFENVCALITVGSQAPALHEIGAFPALDQGGGLPEPFPPWLNVYDERDMLAYLAQPIFKRVSDFRVVSNRQFPTSHSYYWELPAFWQRAAEFIAEC
jgi:hypothetical protein